MQISSILSAAKKNGVTFKDSGNRFYLTKGDRQLEGYMNTANEVTHLTWRSPDTDAMTDCFCDTYYHTIKSAMHFLNPTGEMVRSCVQPITQDASQPSTPQDGIVVRKNEEKGGIEIQFPGKPASDVIVDLKNHGFRWSPFNSVWWKKYTDADMTWAKDRFIPVPAVTA